MLAVVAPGQGAQKAGFLAPWLAEPAARDRLAQLAEAAELDLAAHGTTSDDDTIRDTAVAQPLLVAAGLIAAEALWGSQGPGPSADIVAGHSVGEITAAAIAAVVSPEDAMKLVRERSRAMAAASAVTATSMVAIVGGDADTVLAAIERAGLSVANRNGTGQIVAGGTTDQLARLSAEPPARARLFPLSVAGAFHTEHMAPALAHLQSVVSTLPASDPSLPIVSNADGQVLTSGTEVLQRIVSQVAQQVRWDLCLAHMAAIEVTGLLELVPAGTLSGIAKRQLRNRVSNQPVEVFALNSPDQLDDAQAFLARHLRSSSETLAADS